MKICPSCTVSNLEGTLFCENCGEVLIGVASVETQKIAEGTQEFVGKATWGTARFGRQGSIVLRIREAQEPLVFTPADELVIGRADVATNTNPQLDMTPYSGREKGVSRIHAAIRRGEETLMLVDLGSVNGTHLNGQRLIPNQPRVLRDGDEIRLGTLVCHIYFK